MLGPAITIKGSRSEGKSHAHRIKEGLENRGKEKAMEKNVIKICYIYDCVYGIVEDKRGEGERQRERAICSEAALSPCFPDCIWPPVQLLAFFLLNLGVDVQESLLAKHH